MGRTKTKSDSSSLSSVRRWASLFLRPGTVIHLIFFGTILAAVYVAWRAWGPVIQGDRRYQITLDSVQVTPQPDWIRANVKAEVMDANGLVQHSSLDPQITVTVARAFSVHSWVAHVTRVRKSYPAQLVVDLE